jgi:Zn-dependent M16 (insulinase) family peptidase
MKTVQLSQVVNVSNLLYKEKEFHQVMGSFYHTLFNSMDAGGDPVEVVQKGYSDLRQFYQQQAQYHQCRVLRMSAKIEQYAAAVDNLTAPL